MAGVKPKGDESVNEVSEMWRDHREHLKAMRSKRREKFLGEVADLTATNRSDKPIVRGHKVERLTAYHFRVDGFLDVYPTNRKWHNLKTNTRGTYQFKESLKKLVEAQALLTSSASQ